MMKAAVIHAIIATLDNELEKHGKTFLTPVEANIILEQAGLLSDYTEERGRPLRKLLKAGKIPHAYKVAGKTSQWVIPHSSVRRALDKPHMDYSKRSDGPQK